MLVFFPPRKRNGLNLVPKTQVTSVKAVNERIQPIQRDTFREKKHSSPAILHLLSGKYYREEPGTGKCGLCGNSRQSGTKVIASYFPKIFHRDERFEISPKQLRLDLYTHAAALGFNTAIYFSLELAKPLSCPHSQPLSVP